MDLNWLTDTARTTDTNKIYGILASAEGVI